MGPQEDPGGSAGSSRIRVGHVLTSMGRAGPQGWTLRCVAAADPMLFAVDVVAGRGDPDGPTRLTEAQQLLGPRLHLVEHLARRLSPWRDLLALMALIRLFRERQYDIVHTHMTKAGVLGRLAALLAGVPIIVHTEHGLSLHHSRHAAARTCFDAVQRLGARWSDAVLVVSRADHRVAVEEVGVPEHLLGDGRQGVHPRPAEQEARSTGRRALGIDDDVPLYGTVSRLVPSKRIEDILAAAVVVARRRPDARALIVASGPHERALRDLAVRLAVDDKVTFVPARSDIDVLLPAFDVFVHPSDFEGLPMVVLEAMAAGVPVVAEAAGGTGEVVVDDLTGRLVDIGDAEGLGEAVVELLEDPLRAEQLAGAGRRFVEQHHDAAARAAVIEAIYLRLLASGTDTTRKIGPIRTIFSVRRPASRTMRDSSACV